MTSQGRPDIDVGRGPGQDHHWRGSQCRIFPDDTEHGRPAAGDLPVKQHKRWSGGVLVLQVRDGLVGPYFDLDGNVEGLESPQDVLDINLVIFDHKYGFGETVIHCPTFISGIVNLNFEPGRSPDSTQIPP